MSSRVYIDGVMVKTQEKLSESVIRKNLTTAWEACPAGKEINNVQFYNVRPGSGQANVIRMFVQFDDGTSSVMRAKL